ncbi:MULTISPECIES: exodeoxyribonuclease V subunit beta [Nitrosomonas]|uniref:RecBCD enzyme subunit RecB n=2 Tax=Nitrosomonas eutropha TaxID=916 RepID=A0ABX5M828_9PROT|nr:MULTISPECIES: exodeoxyribonuclease V subunit beta [Nitrosomonas]ABI59604.1 DNA helicase/exodeoxyribonuclease V, beta subunit [Nitrosomonas eutropha C91]MXS81125.1 exodeoxyribonuclease V subunit beta [Nitrosomonas sp. GH22]PXV79822.1 DNA helicase/exodeoxyribonuclease V beta subunit [Nitrosomonas eutropha]SDW93386.1 DNA helicase/exodeoxyribonuclease V, beta subunit [Nitrosomonas eutropha]SEJ24817.1 DNA helicase/exodeoxyribonuclease V, beta subunit [Nitrosomonas eutropha]
MSQNITPLDLFTLPLTGSHLIEASAGTGKTFTIAMLYVRLILGHQGEFAFSGGALTPPEILVVTFTEAATKELRDRIRARLTEAARLFRADPINAQSLNDTDPLQQLLFEYSPAEWAACARKLELAAEWMDEAAISTIHGWCNRMLREHAFDSQSLFTQELETDQTELRAEVVRDYWRIFYYPLTLEEIVWINGYWKSPTELGKAVTPLLDYVDQLPDLSATDPSTIISASQENKQNLLTKLKQPWALWADELQALLDAAEAAGQIDGRKLRADWYTNWLNKLRDWANDPAMDNVDIGKGWERLTSEGIAKAWKKGTSPHHPAFDTIPVLKEALNNLPDPRIELLSHAACWIAKKFDTIRKHRSQIGFNDLLTGLETALTGLYGERLAQVIRQQFPVALIDEFQDTDPVQYRIFEYIYEISSNRNDCALILIGDPKQAIYAFRGADIHTYLKARRAVEGRLYTLNTNFRSTQAMVDAVNHCFASVENQADSRGAFLFRTGDGNPVPFLEVQANGRRDTFQIEGETLPAMLLAVSAQQMELSKTDYIEQMSALCATRIVDWLNDGKSAKAGFAGQDMSFRAVRPGDIAILVNNGNEAANIRQALLQRGVRSVYLSDKDTVYATRQATEVHRWLAACAEPDNDRLLRAALSTTSLGLTLAELDALNTDEAAWEAQVIQFKGYRELWQKQGVLPMLRRILVDFKCGDRLLALKENLNGQSGERILTDLLHLAEILQQASFTLEGEHALIRFLAEQIAAPEGEADSKKLRLESDSDLVKVVTIHKSKGLEYPLVFLPFICITRPIKNSDIPLKWHDDQGTLKISLAAHPEIMARADLERLREDVRKLYVALTRACYLTWMGLAPIKNKSSAVGHLFRLKATPAEQYLDALQSFVQERPDFCVTDKPDNNLEQYVAETRSAPPGEACRPLRMVRENWRISSYSALRVDGNVPSTRIAQEDTPQAENLLEEQLERSFISLQPVSEQPASVTIHHFFKGAEAGIFLHELMEWVANTGFTIVSSDETDLRDTIERRCKMRHWETWVAPLVDWVKRMLSTSLPFGSIGICLNTLTVVKAEMEFWAEASNVDLTLLDAAVIEQTLASRPRPHLTQSELNGMLKGFIDLVFQYDGRYYVADYKSNWLGATDQDYTVAAMDEVIRANRYDLQYVIYLFALHRLLKSRLPDYNYEQHVGGAACLFVRGIDAPTAGVHFERPPGTLMDTLDELFAGKTEGSA